MGGKYVLIRNLTILFIVCNILYWLFPFPPIIWRMALVLLSLMALLGRKHQLLPCEKAVLFFAVFNLFHFFISYLWKTPHATSLGNTLCGFLSLILFSLLSEKGVMTNRAILITGVLLVVASVLGFNYFGNILQSKRDVEGDTTNNFSEYFLMLLPLLFFIKKPILKWTLLVVCLFFLILGAKRGNIIAAVIPLLLLIYRDFKDNKRSTKQIFLTIIIIGVVAFLIYYWVGNNEYLLYRFEQTQKGDSSGRDRIYRAAWQLWHNTESNFLLIFGYGYEGVVDHIKSAAHNDWLEILIDYGLVGVVLYLLIFVLFVRQIRFTKNPKLKMVLVSAICILFAKSLYSMSFNTGTLPLLMISMGTALGYYKKPKIKIKN